MEIFNLLSFQEKDENEEEEKEKEKDNDKKKEKEELIEEIIVKEDGDKEKNGKIKVK